MSENLTRRMAHLARLELSESEIELFSSQMGEIISYVELLGEVDVRGVAPMVHPLEWATQFREDEVKPSLVDDAGKPKILQSAPETLYDGYKVPPIL
ncbi:Asp-tRNA(Asn)/Glu-tRNA(Gln) amidotransferase subunit GatC [Bdellovibrionota bacterium FG-1]